MTLHVYKNIDPRHLNHLKHRVNDVMVKIRKLTPYQYVDPEIAKGSELWNDRLDGKQVKRAIIYLRSSGCSWAVHNRQSDQIKFKAGCLDCEHSVSGTTLGLKISEKQYMTQFMREFKKYDYKDVPILCVYNEGNFFNESELPLEARVNILTEISKNANIKVVILETLPEYLSEQVLIQTKKILENKIVEIGIGLESSNEIIRNLCINKSYSLKLFEKTIGLIKQYFHVLSYVLIKPSFLSEQEALEDAISTIEYAFTQGIDIVSIEPVNISNHNMSGYLNRLGLYRPVWLWSIIEIMKVTHKLGELRVGGFQFEPKYEWQPYNCKKCTKKIQKELFTYNESNNPSPLFDIRCGCVEEWKSELTKKKLPLIERIDNYISEVEFNLSLQYKAK